MTREEKIEKRKKRNSLRVLKNVQRNEGRWKRSGRRGYKDCPYDVDINGMYGTCHCGGVNYSECLGDI